jgi:hypothetical protein
MKKSLCILLICCTISLVNAQPKPKFANANKVQLAEASCGQCQFKMAGKGCDLAVRINGKSYFVDGTKIDDHGDAHAKDGFCEKIRKAEIKGSIVNNRFLATYFKLLPETVKNN